jgi:predicted ATPase
VHAYLQSLSLPQEQKALLDLLLDHPGAPAATYTDRLSVGRATYFRHRHKLAQSIAAYLRDWHIPAGASPLVVVELAQPAPDKRTNLLDQRARLIGRAQEVEMVCALMRSDEVRLVTLTGPGGAGKTRLALHVARELACEFADGVRVVALDVVRDPGLVAASIAHSLDLKYAAQQPPEQQLSAFLKGRHMLLVLDNFEQLLAAAPLLDGLLAAAPWLKLLITSRALLHTSDEQEFPVPPLALPNLRRLPPLRVLAEVPSVALFMIRAQTATPEFTLTNENAKTVAEICVHLEGLPLAIELAAARTRLFSPQAIRERLNQRLQLLSGGVAGLPARQGSLRAVLAWSYELLDLAEQQLFARLAVFVGGFTVDAVEQVCGDDIDVLNGLSTLLDNNLLWREVYADGEPRFGMLETIRAYAVDRLAAEGDTTTRLRQRHALYALQLVERIAPQLSGPRQVQLLDELAREHENIRAAIEWLLMTKQVELAAALGCALWRYWISHGHLREARGWMQQVLEQREHLSIPLRAQVVGVTAGLAFHQSDLLYALPLFEEHVTLERALGDPPRIARASNSLGVVLREQGQYGRAQQLFEESLCLYRELGNQQAIGAGLHNLGLLAHLRGNSAAGIALLEESLALRRRVGDVWGIAFALNDLAHLLVEQRQFERAPALFEECLGLFHQLGERQGIAASLCYQATMLFEQQQYAEARALLIQSLRLRQELGEMQGIHDCLIHLGRVAGATARPSRAARLYGAAEALSRMTSIALPAIEQARHAQYIAQAQLLLPPGDWARAWRQGQALSLEQALSYAMAENDEC